MRDIGVRKKTKNKRTRASPPSNFPSPTKKRDL
jgi:hypothetical protein